MEGDATVVTIDGPAGAGKSTVSRLVAKRLGLTYLDTGAMYRAVALAVRANGIDPEDHDSLAALCDRLEISFDNTHDPPRILLNGRDVSQEIRTPEIDMLASRVSAVRPVRQAMTHLQRKVAGHTEGVVAEGRDMGTVVFPWAQWKFFLTATLEERVRRRYQELVQRGEKVRKNGIAKDIKRRDEQDTKRALAPLRPAEDAIIIDTTKLTIEQVVDKICGIVQSEIGQSKK